MLSKKKAATNWYDEMDDDDFEMIHTMDSFGKQDGMCGEVPANVKLAHAYVPFQCYHKAFCPAEALTKGTLFPELWGVYPIPR